MKTVFIVFCLLISFSLKAQQFYDSTLVSDQAHVIAHNTTHYHTIYRKQNPNKYYRFGGLEKGENQLYHYIRLSESDLKYLLNHPCPQVRCESFYVIIHRNATF